MNKLVFCTTLLLIFFFSISCNHKINNGIIKKGTNLKNIDEVEILEIKLSGEISKKSSEISGLCWYDNNLILLPQYPGRFDLKLGKIFYIEKQVLLSYIFTEDSSAIYPKFFTIDLSSIENLFSLGSGFESITINEGVAYFTIENMNNGVTESLLISAEIDSINKRFEINKNSLVKDQSNLFIYNISDESILYYENNIIPIYELFGKNINNKPEVSVFSSDLVFQSRIDFPNIEYRITDVTAVDDSGYFWAINYFYPGDLTKLNPARDIIFDKYGIGKSHLISKPVERLVQFEVNKNQIVLSEKEPIYLKLMKNDSRNWEGIVKLDDHGFIIVTDTFPKTILAFVKH